MRKAEGTNVITSLKGFPSTLIRPYDFGSIRMLFQATITDAEFAHFFERDELAYHMATRLTGDCFNKWFDMETEEEHTKATLENTFEKLKVKQVFRLAYMYAKVFGMSLIAFDWKDKSNDLTEEPTGITGLDKISAIPKTHVKDIVRVKDRKAKNYGTITHYILRFEGDSGSEEEVKIPASRFLRITNHGIDGTPEGMSMFKPLFDKFIIKKNADYATGETLWANAKGLDVLEMPQGATKEAKAWAKAEWRDFNVKSHAIIPHGFKPYRLDSNKSLKPKDYYDWILNSLGSGSRIGKTMLTGVQAGAVTGAEWNMKDYHGFISDEQSEFIEPHLKEFVEIGQKFVPKMFPKGKVKFVWRPTLEMSEKDLADIRNKDASTANMLGMFLMYITQNQLDLATQDEKLYVMLPGKNQGIYVQGFKIKELTDYIPLPLPAPKGEPGTTAPIGLNRVIITDEEHRKLKEDWELKIDRVAPKFTAELGAAVSTYEESWLEEFEKIWNEADMGNSEKVNAVKTLNMTLRQMRLTRIRPTPDKFNTVDRATYNDIKDLLEKLSKIEGTTKDVEKVFNDHLKGSYEEGAQQTNEALGISYEFPLEDPLVFDWLDAHGELLKTDITTDINSRFMRGIRDGLQNGESYKQINDRLREITAKYQKGIPNTVHKVVHEAMNRARGDTLKTEGHKTVIYLTMRDGLVRDDHRPREGQEYSIDVIGSLLGEYGCRCTYFPKPALDSLRKLTPVEWEQ